MLEMHTSKKNSPNNNPSCFSNIFDLFLCKGNISRHPCCPPNNEFPEMSNNTKNNVENNNDSDIVVRSRVQTQGSPGIVARLMGLDALPPSYENTRKSSSTSYDSLFRSKSLNSVHFLPDFGPTRAAFHRRARTSSASFHEQDQGHAILVRIAENSGNESIKMKDFEAAGRVEMKQKKPEKRENGLMNLKGNDGKKSSEITNIRGHQERYYRGNTSPRTCSNNRLKTSNLGKNNAARNENKLRKKCANEGKKSANKERNMKVGSNVLRKKKVDHKHDVDVEVQSDVSSRSPISVLDNHLEFDFPSRDNANAIQTTSNSRRKSSRKIKVRENTPKPNKKDDDSCTKIATKDESVQENAEVPEYFVDLSSSVCKLAEAQLSKDMKNDITRYELLKVHFMEELCIDFGQELVEFLLNELTDELVG